MRSLTQPRSLCWILILDFGECMLVAFADNNKKSLMEGREGSYVGRMNKRSNIRMKITQMKERLVKNEERRIRCVRDLQISKRRHSYGQFWLTNRWGRDVKILNIHRGNYSWTPCMVFSLFSNVWGVINSMLQ